MFGGIFCGLRESRSVWESFEASRKVLERLGDFCVFERDLEIDQANF